MFIRQKFLKHGYTDSVTDVIFYIVCKILFSFGFMEAFDSMGIWNVLTLQLSLSLRDR